MSLLLMIVFGAIVGFIASYIMRSPHGVLMDVVLGIIGAFVGGLLMNLLGQPGVTGFDLYSFIVAIVGAVVVIGLYRVLVERRSFRY